MDYLPNNATIDEACEWLQHQTIQKWTLPRLLEDGHLTPYVWIDHIKGYPQIFGSNLEGYLTKMVYHGDVMRLAADRNDALLTMFTAHDGRPVKPDPGWRVELKNIRFKKKHIERVAEIINSAKASQAAPVVEVPTVPGSATIWTDARKTEASTYRKKHGLKKTAEHYGVSQATISKHIPAGKPQKKPLGVWHGLTKK